METTDKEQRAALMHRGIGVIMHTMRMHHRIVEQRVDGMRSGLHHSQHRLLMMLSKVGRTTSQKDIARMMNVTPACVARALKSLSQSGMVERGEATQDGRCNEVCLSEKGAQIVQESHKLFQALDLEMYEGFTDEEIHQLISLMERLNRNLANMDSAQEADK